VFLAMLNTWAAKRPAAERRGLDFLHGVAFERRQALQVRLVEAAESSFEPNTVLAPLGEPEDFAAPRRLGDLAEHAVNELLGRFDAELEVKSSEYSHLHQVRILGKRVRYALEVFADCFAPAFRSELYPAVEKMQEILGDANDSHVATERLTELREAMQTGRPVEWKRFGPGILILLKHHQQRLPQLRRQFAAWQREWRKLRMATPHWEPVAGEVTEKA
jgi:CHAD domain-containing protein